MSIFNSYMNCHFSNCRLLARAYDDCRNRKVSLHQIPGYWDVVGVSDGTDAWIAPVSTGPFFRTASGNVVEIMRRLQAGEDVGPVPEAPRGKQKRHAVSLEDAFSRTTPAPQEPSTQARGRRHVVFA